MTEAEKVAFDNTNMYLERSMACMLALWSALIGIDGVFVGAASILASLDPSHGIWLLIGILACSSISMLLLLLNFHSTRHVYRVLSMPPPKEPAQVNAYDAILREQTQRARQLRRNCDRREQICYFLLAAVAIEFALWICMKS